MSKTYVETSVFFLADIDQMIRKGLYHDRSEAVNDAVGRLLKQYKLSKLHAKDAVRRSSQLAIAQ